MSARLRERKNVFEVMLRGDGEISSSSCSELRDFLESAAAPLPWDEDDSECVSSSFFELDGPYRSRP